MKKMPLSISSPRRCSPLWLALSLALGGAAGAQTLTPQQQRFHAIYKELVANRIQNSYMVASGVLAVNRAQEYGFTLLSAL